MLPIEVGIALAEIVAMKIRILSHFCLMKIGDNRRKSIPLILSAI